MLFGLDEKAEAGFWPALPLFFQLF